MRSVAFRRTPALDSLVRGLLRSHFASVPARASAPVSSRSGFRSGAVMASSRSGLDRGRGRVASPALTFPEPVAAPEGVAAVRAVVRADPVVLALLCDRGVKGSKERGGGAEEGDGRVWFGEDAERAHDVVADGGDPSDAARSLFESAEADGEGVDRMHDDVGYGGNGGRNGGGGGGRNGGTNGGGRGGRNGGPNGGGRGGGGRFGSAPRAGRGRGRCGNGSSARRFSPAPHSVPGAPAGVAVVTSSSSEACSRVVDALERSAQRLANAGRLEYDAFISLPLSACDASLSSAVAALRRAATDMPEAEAAGFRAASWTAPPKLHLTLRMLRLYSPEAWRLADEALVAGVEAWRCEERQRGENEGREPDRSLKGGKNAGWGIPVRLGSVGRFGGPENAARVLWVEPLEVQADGEDACGANVAKSDRAAQEGRSSSRLAALDATQEQEAATFPSASSSSSISSSSSLQRRLLSLARHVDAALVARGLLAPSEATPPTLHATLVKIRPGRRRAGLDAAALGRVLATHPLEGRRTTVREAHVSARFATDAKTGYYLPNSIVNL